MKKALSVFLICSFLLCLIGCTGHNNLINVKIDESKITMPILDLTGETDGITKTNEVKVTAEYTYGSKSFTSLANIKYQGESSLNYPKKNFTVKFINDDGTKNKVMFNSSWGYESKYCLKANYIDYSQARNVVSGKIYGQIVHSRGLNDDFDSLVNGGGVDGFPIVLTLNGKFLGLYTLNIPKDEWLFGMNGDSKQAILMGDDWTSSVALHEKINGDFSNGWSLEYCSTERSDTSWVTDSFNSLIDFVCNSSNEEFRQGIKERINFERTVDSLIFTYFVCAEDNTAKNVLWVTFDGGEHWSSSIYDFDGSWGLRYDGKDFYASDYLLPDTVNSNMLWRRLYENFYGEIKARYEELRLDVLSYENICSVFDSFESLIDEEARICEKKKWKFVPNKKGNNIESIKSFVRERISVYDIFFSEK